MFDFVIGFAGSSTLPTQICKAFGQLIERIGVDKTAGIWDTIIRVIRHNLHLLQVNLLVAVYKEHGQDCIVVRKIGRHTLPMHPWGSGVRLLQHARMPAIPTGLFHPEELI